MKARVLILLVALLAAVHAFGQSPDSTVYVKQFPGLDVGAKVQAAMASCPALAPCLVVIDPSLASFPSGSIPGMCGNCYLVDYRGGPPAFSSSNSSSCVNVRAWGAKGDGVVDDTSKVNAAIAAAGAQGCVYLPAGKYRVTGAGVTLLSQQTLRGDVKIGSPGGVVATEIVCDSLTGSGCVMPGALSVLRDLSIVGPGMATAATGVYSNASNASYYGVLWKDWRTALSTGGDNYTEIGANCEFKANDVAVLLTNENYNFKIWSTRFDLTPSGGYGGKGIIAASASANTELTVIGSSFENFNSSGAINLYGQSQLTLIGDYWEDMAVLGGDGVTFSNSINSSTITAIGNFVYLQSGAAGYIDRWINLSAAANVSLNSSGNHFIAGSASGSTATAYYFPASATSDVNIQGDNWAAVTAGTNVYTAALNSGPVANANVVPPLGVATLGQWNYLGRAPWVLNGIKSTNCSGLFKSDGTCVAVPPGKSGTPTAGAGVCWKDSSTLGTCTAGTWPNCSTCN